MTTQVALGQLAFDLESVLPSPVFSPEPERRPVITTISPVEPPNRSLPESKPMGSEAAAELWSPEDIQTLKTRMLMKSLRELNSSKTSKALLQSIGAWVAKPLRMEGYADPLSFQDCCIAADLEPIAMRNQLQRMFPDLIK